MAGLNTHIPLVISGSKSKMPVATTNGHEFEIFSCRRPRAIEEDDLPGVHRSDGPWSFRFTP
jgi:hypothetical protein